ncbi:hypothetical protein AB0J63_17060 [Streptosporangium canum]|uniref:hypothetical protein n=1 Tax=Streptosporangium canum TaxID=324952 RepID=UPI003419B4AB
MKTRTVLVVLGALAMGPAGCASSDRVPAEQAVTRFYTAVHDRHGEQACSLLTPEAAESLRTGGQTCAETVLDLDLPGGQVRDAEVWGDEAQVRLTRDTVFLLPLTVEPAASVTATVPAGAVRPVRRRSRVPSV